MAQTINAKDTVSAKKAECFITIEGKRYNFMQAIDLEAKMEKNKSEVPILGRTTKGNKTTGSTNTGSATFHIILLFLENYFTDIKKLVRIFILTYKLQMKTLHLL